MRFPNPLTFLRALFRFARRPEVAAPHVVNIREARCQLCPFYDAGQCQVCTCAVSVKVILATESCPAGKWGEYFSPNKTGL